MMTFSEWREEYERRYERLPRWFFSPLRCKAEYIAYCERWEEKNGKVYDQAER